MTAPAGDQAALGEGRCRPRAADSVLVRLFGQQALGGLDALEAVGQRLPGDLLDLEPAGGQVDPGDAGGRAVDGDGGEEVVGAAVEDVLLGEGARGHDAGHVAVHEAFGLGGVLDLLADGDAVAGADEAFDVALGGVVREAGHGDGVGAFVARGEGEAQVAGAGLGVVKEDLVEIAHAEEEDGVLVPLFEGQVLPHHGCDVALRHVIFRAGEGTARPACCLEPLAQ
jgi:hypothetical protein